MSIFRNDRRQLKYLSDQKSKLSAIFILETKGTKNDKFSIFTGPFLRKPMDMIFDVFSETNVRLLKSIVSQFFSKYSKSYSNLNVKSCFKLNDP